MTSILDIDLDYFNLFDRRAERLERLLEWAACPVTHVVRSHHVALRRWQATLAQSGLPAPTHILHVDEHHDMMDERPAPNIANVIYHAMRTWPEVRVHWVFEQAIDSPAEWLSEETWEDLRHRFSASPQRPRGWPRPQIVTVCTSPGFVVPGLLDELMVVVARTSVPRGRTTPGRAEARLHRCTRS